MIFLLRGKIEKYESLIKRRWLSRRQGLEKEAGLRRIPLQPADRLYYNEENNKKSKVK